MFSADVIKMYRQILVDLSQKILWRDDPANDVDTYELMTVTYGTSSASYLATRCLIIMLINNQVPGRFKSREKQFLCRRFFVWSGQDFLHEARVLRDELTELLSMGSFELSKSRVI